MPCEAMNWSWPSPGRSPPKAVHLVKFAVKHDYTVAEVLDASLHLWRTGFRHEY